MKTLERRLAKLEAGRRGALRERLQNLSIEELTAELDWLINHRLGRPDDYPVTAAEREQRARAFFNRWLGRPLDYPVSEADRQRVFAQGDAQIKRRCG